MVTVQNILFPLYYISCCCCSISHPLSSLLILLLSNKDRIKRTNTYVRTKLRQAKMTKPSKPRPAHEKTANSDKPVLPRLLAWGFSIYHAMCCPSSPPLRARSALTSDTYCSPSRNGIRYMRSLSVGSLIHPCIGIALSMNEMW